MNSALIRKYDVPGPRYTSYPTVPFWKNDPMPLDKWMESLHTNYNKFNSSDVSVYVHLPFCESLCTFCGCHKRITKNHQVESPYIDAVIKEWNLYKENLDFDPRIRELHFGGGTPTFFAPDELIRLLENLFNTLSVDPEECELSFEAHPNNTTEDHLKKLYDFGFRRLSLGVQDYNPEVQKAIHRIQPFETVEKVHNMARQMGYSSISHDLVFGLPKQSLDNIIETVSKTLLLKPDRISLYSYAHVPWIKGNGQRGFDENDLPKSEVKRELYETAKKMLESAGYLEIGMDHFALPEDSLSIAFDQKNLHRNFMGYTTMNTSMMIGLGMSAISDSWFAFAQNDKSVEGYIEKVNKGEFPVYRGHLLTDQELETRKYILDLMCHFETTLESDSSYRNEHFQIAERLKEMVTDGLVIIENDHVKVTEKGVPFVRNCCMAFDQHLQKVNSTEKMFSRTI
ncbi:MAG: oxygen-independent coproporphyrinogen III oxidase [Bacteroidetes bacterium]|nr:MAG: oxygen-independent coproporphyrinogen III oxidase [Bacteroidota bacterium]